MTGPETMLLGAALLATAGCWHLFVVQRFEGDADMGRDVEQHEVMGVAQARLALAFDLPMVRIELDYANQKLYVPLPHGVVPFTVEAVMQDNAPGLRSKAAQWQSDHARSARA